MILFSGNLFFGTHVIAAIYFFAAIKEPETLAEWLEPQLIEVMDGSRHAGASWAQRA